MATRWRGQDKGNLGERGSFGERRDEKWSIVGCRRRGRSKGRKKLSGGGKVI